MSGKLDTGKVTDTAALFKQKLGIYMCLLYALAYAGFVFISVYDVTLMDSVMFLGLNLSSFYGIGLIVFALFLSMIYSFACTKKEKENEKKRNKEEQGDEI